MSVHLGHVKMVVHVLMELVFMPACVLMVLLDLTVKQVRKNLKCRSTVLLYLLKDY